MRTWCLRLGFCLLTVLAVSCTFPTPDSTGPLNVVLVVVDTLRADHLGCYGHPDIETPNIDALARRGVRFSHAASQVPLTLPSHCSIMTGTYPIFHGVRDNGTFYLDESRITLAEVLKEEGYRTGAVIGAFPLDSRFGLDQGFDTYDDRTAVPGSSLARHEKLGANKVFFRERRAEEVTETATEWLSEHAEEKFFLWVHYFDPHAPYEAPEPYSTAYSNPYDGEIAYTDEWVGRLIGTLETLGIEERTLIVFTSDHGEGLLDHEEESHGIFVYDSTIRVPLILSCPGVLPEGTVVEDLVRTIDIMPTVLDILGVSQSKDNQGVSLLPLMTGQTERLDLPSYSESLYCRLNYGWAELTSLQVSDWKYISAPRPELYNLRDDPGEQTNLVTEEPKVAEKLQRQLDELVKRYSSDEAHLASSRPMDQETAERLRSLGYLQANVPTGEEGQARASARDPKDMIAVLNRLSMAQLQADMGLLKEAAEGFEGVIEIDPDNFQAHYFSGLCYLQMQSLDRALAALVKASELAPADPGVHQALGHTYRKKGLHEQAVAALRRALSLNPNDPEPHRLLAELFEEMGMKDEALAERARADELAPHGPQEPIQADISQDHDVRERIVSLKSRLDENPQDTDAHFDLGLLYFNQGRLDEAVIHYSKAVDIDPKHIQARNNLGLIYAMKGKYTDAKQQWETVLKLDPEHITSKLNLEKLKLMGH